MDDDEEDEEDEDLHLEPMDLGDAEEGSANLDEDAAPVAKKAKKSEQ